MDWLNEILEKAVITDGKQILELLMKYCIDSGGTEFYYSTRSGNLLRKHWCDPVVLLINIQIE